MLRAAILVFTATFTLMGARAEDIRVFVSNTTGASQYFPAVGPGYVVRPAPHLDLNVIWNADTQTFSGGFRTDDETPVVQFGPEDAIAYLPATGQRQRDDDSEQYNFQGAMDATYWTFPSSADASNNAFTLYLGFSAYGVPRNGTSPVRVHPALTAFAGLSTPWKTSPHLPPPPSTATASPPGM